MGGAIRRALRMKWLAHWAMNRRILFGVSDNQVEVAENIWTPIVGIGGAAPTIRLKLVEKVFAHRTHACFSPPLFQKKPL